MTDLTAAADLLTRLNRWRTDGRGEMPEPREITAAIESIGRLCAVYCTGRRAKLEYMTEVGRIPDVWIDDSPMFITQGAAVSRFVRRS